jgi:murein L,D-transpeptidase YcbB/YkuD
VDKLRFVAVSLSGVALAFTSPAVAAAATADGQSAAVPVTAAVASFYDTWRSQSIWFRNGPNSAAIAELTAILQRAPFDGFPEGPQLAAEVQAAAVQANSGKPEDMANAERVLSSAWVQYAQAIRKPTAGMIYAYPVLKPQVTRLDEILLTAAAAPSLAAYLASASDVNAIYKQLRDTAWAEAQATGNMTPDPRLLANLDRVRSLPAKGRFLLVDSGSSMLTLYQDGERVDSMKVITGMEQLPTPLIASYMYYITYNPYWHAPDHLVRKTIAPNFLHGGMTYFKSHGYHVIEDWSEHPTVIDPTSVDWKGAAAGKVHLKIQQDPGPLNSMGILKFPFQNPEDIYLHDTPDHAKFSLSNRNLSNGCVRVEDAKRLGRWLLGHDPVSPGSEAELRVQLPQPTRIYLTYITAEVKDGKLSYLPDLYGWDRTPPQFASSN